MDQIGRPKPEDSNAIKSKSREDRTSNNIQNSKKKLSREKTRPELELMKVSLKKRSRTNQFVCSNNK